MHTIKHTQDGHLIKAILELDGAYDSLAYDDSMPLNQYIPKGMWFILEYNNALAGLINLEPLNNVMWQCHIFIFEQFRGQNSEQWGILVAKYMREELGAKKFLAFTPYITAKHYAERMGFKYIATLHNSIKKHGTYMSQYLLELGEENI